MASEGILRFGAFAGLDQSAHESLTPVGATHDAVNMDTEGGVLRTGKGITRLLDVETDAPIETLARFDRRIEGGGAQRSILLSAGDTLYALENGELNPLRSGLGSAYMDTLTYQKGMNDIILFANGEDTLFSWDGEEIREIEGAPRLSCLTLHYERVWGAGEKEEPDRVYYSRDFDPEDWQSEESGTIDVPTWNGGSVRVVRTLFNDVVVFKDHDIFRIYGTYPGEYEVGRVHGVVGPIAPRSVVTTGDMVYFLSANGICFYDGIKAQTLAEAKLQKVFARLSRSYADRAVAIVHGHKLLMALPLDGATSNNAVIEADLRRGTFMLRESVSINAMLSLDDELLVACGGGIYRYGEGETYDGAKFRAYWQTPELDLGTYQKKRSVALHMHACGEGGKGFMRVTARFDGKVKQRLIALPEAMRPLRVRLTGKARKLSLRFENVDGSSFTIESPSLQVEMEGE